MMYKLGCYNVDGSLECLRTIKGENAKERAKSAYEYLKDEYRCTIWTQKIEFVDPKEEFEDQDGNKVNKSLLSLLKEEDDLVKDTMFNQETYEMLKDKNKHLAADYLEKTKNSKEKLFECRKEISRYLDFLEALREE